MKSHLKNIKKLFDYDLIVIGGGSGGLASSKEAIRCGAKKVLVFDFVRPSTQGSKWGLGGTCVNVGCIPKKLMHYAGSMKWILKNDSNLFGWKSNSNGLTHDWSSLVNHVQLYIKKLNFMYRVELRSKSVEYINARAKLEGPNEVSYIQDSKKISLTAENILLAVGSRPFVPPENEVMGAQKYAITSDDLFSMKKDPGKCLIVGGSYVALECAGFLTELGYPVTVSVRSVLLRGFDSECAEKIRESLLEIGTRIVDKVPHKIEKTDDDKLKVYFNHDDSISEEYDTVLYATGRIPETQYVNSDNIVRMDEKGKIICQNEQTNVPSIYCIGDCLSGAPELTPTAIKAGELLMRRIFANSTETMNWKYVPTVVFTPVEYACIGLTEEEAKKTYGDANIECYLLQFNSVELSASHRPKVEHLRKDEYDDELSPSYFFKMICNKNDQFRVVGLHLIGEHTSEMIQGYSLALKLGVTKNDFDQLVSVHPTSAEALNAMDITKSSGESYVSTGGCGGGKCG